MQVPNTVTGTLNKKQSSPTRRVQTGLPAGPLLREPAVGAVGVLEAAAAQDNGPKTAEFILERDERTAKKALQAALDQQDTTVTTFTAEVITTYAHIPLPFKLLARSMVAPYGEDTYSIIVVTSVEGHSVADGYDKYGHRLTSVNIAHLAQAQFLYRTQLKVTAADLPTWLFSPERIIQCLAAGQTPFWAKVGKLQQAQQLGFEGNRGPSIKADHYTIPAPVSLVEERQQRGRTKPHKPVELLMGSWPHEQWPEVFCCVYIVEWAIDVYLVGSPKQRKVDARRISMNAVQFAELKQLLGKTNTDIVKMLPPNTHEFVLARLGGNIHSNYPTVALPPASPPHAAAAAAAAAAAQAAPAAAPIQTDGNNNSSTAPPRPRAPLAPRAVQALLLPAAAQNAPQIASKPNSTATATSRNAAAGPVTAANKSAGKQQCSTATVATSNAAAAAACAATVRSLLKPMTFSASKQGGAATASTSNAAAAAVRALLSKPSTISAGKQSTTATTTSSDAAAATAHALLPKTVTFSAGKESVTAMAGNSNAAAAAAAAAAHPLLQKPFVFGAGEKSGTAMPTSPNAAAAATALLLLQEPFSFSAGKSSGSATLPSHNATGATVPALLQKPSKFSAGKENTAAAPSSNAAAATVLIALPKAPVRNAAKHYGTLKAAKYGAAAATAQVPPCTASTQSGGKQGNTAAAANSGAAAAVPALPLEACTQRGDKLTVLNPSAAAAAGSAADSAQGLQALNSLHKRGQEPGLPAAANKLRRLGGEDDSKTT